MTIVGSEEVVTWMSDRGAACVVLCAHCADQRQADPSAAALEALRAPVVSGCCHDCGGGFCMCRGSLPCELCPRRNSPVLVQGLTFFRLLVPPAAETVPAALGGDS